MSPPTALSDLFTHNSSNCLTLWLQAARASLEEEGSFLRLTLSHPRPSSHWRRPLHLSLLQALLFPPSKPYNPIRVGAIVHWDPGTPGLAWQNSSIPEPVFFSEEGTPSLSGQDGGASTPLRNFLTGLYNALRGLPDPLGNVSPARTILRPCTVHQ